MASTLKHKIGFALLLLLLTAGALLVHGYHPFVEDAEIYLPTVESLLDSRLFPVGREFFGTQASLTLFPNLIAWSIHAAHVPLEYGLFVWHATSIFLLLLGCWQLSGMLFKNLPARAGSVCLVAALLTIPVAGTALYIMDQYLNPRNLAAFAGVFALGWTLKKKYLPASLCLLFSACVHPLMTAFTFSLCALLLMAERFEQRDEYRFSRARAANGIALLLPFGISLSTPNSPAYHAAAMRHGFHYIQLWQWYEWVGILAPVLLFWWFARIARASQRLELERVCRALIVYDLVFFFAALALDLPARFESLARLQPLRSLHLLYILLFVIIGGLLGEVVLKSRLWRWALLFVPLATGMFLAQRSLFAASSHIDLPGRPLRNPWAQAFMWVRENTPVDAAFAMDPSFLQLPGEDEYGFRCLAERSRLADTIKDSGTVSMFPPLAEHWFEEIQDQTPWKEFHPADFNRLRTKYGVNWIILQQPGTGGLDCAYENTAVKVCRVREMP